MRRVEIALAFAWTCPDCDRRNTEEGEPPAMTDAERDEAARRIYELEEWQEVPDGELMQVPDRLQCRCGEWFHTSNGGEGDE